MRLVHLQEKTQERWYLSYLRKEKKAAQCQPGRGSLAHIKCPGSFNLDFPDSLTVRNKLLFKPSSVHNLGYGSLVDSDRLV